MQYKDAVLAGLYLFGKSDFHRHYTISDFNSYLIFPLLNDKVQIFYDGDLPVGIVTWCWFTDEEAKDFINHQWTPPEEAYKRTTGDQLWVIEMISTHGQAPKMMRFLRRKLAELYGTGGTAYFRRSHTPQKLHARRF